MSLQLAVAGCSTPERLPAVPVSQISQTSEAFGPIRFLVSRETDSFAAEALRAQDREKQWLASQGQGPDLPPAYFLAVSGGGDNGAYGAGFLNGWTASGTRPQFKVVTGISTGALIAPFAFLGPKYDYVLERVYTSTAQQDIFKKRGIMSALFGDSMADTRPLHNVISSYVNRELLDEIAAEYAKGRILLVGTTNLDSLEPVIWNMGAIASRKDPEAVALFANILLASASIPGAFPPVMLDVNLGGTRYQEMHVDGGTVAQLFLYPPSVSAKNAAPRKRVAYILRNARLDADWASTERRTMTIAMRAIDSLTRTQGIGDLYRVYSVTQRDGVDFNLTYIPATFNVPHNEMFDTAFMKALYDVGVNAAKSGYNWQKSPPGFDVPITGQTPSSGH
ncbi:patatin-like phospholipase family protein [Sphingomonas sp. RB56-2]|uniref:Patatin-like phospholipase family protein n=1 Tax=Sphingomonas brevis TaxID=2908206 RepID=A0ABT0SB12_9SPHN|nr:patatin-like phospholipase family protein [Sphingomonas brevis]